MSVLALAILAFIAAFAHGKLPVAFQPNQGQADTQVQEIAHGNGYTLALRVSPAELLGLPFLLDSDRGGLRRTRETDRS